MSSPFSVNLEPWQGQSQLCSVGFHFKEHPKWEQRFVVGIQKSINVLPRFEKS